MRDATWSGTIRDWLPLSWRTGDGQEGDVDREEAEPLTDGDEEQQTADEDRAGDADLACGVVSEVSLLLPVRRSRRVGWSKSHRR